MSTRLAFVAVLLSLYVPLFAQDKPPKPTHTPMPLNTLKGAKEGDWATYSGQETMGKEKRPGSMTFRVRTLAGDVAEVVVATIDPGGSNEETLKLSVKEGPRLEDIFRGGMQIQASDVKVTDDKRKLGDREIECKKVSAAVNLGGDGGTLVLWVSSEVKALGIVEMKMNGKDYTADMKLVGEGNGEKAEWGRVPEKAPPPKSPPSPKGEPAKPAEATKTPYPFNPLKDAKAGDWATYVLTVNTGKEKMRVPVTYRVQSINGDEVDVVTEVQGGDKPDVHHKKLSRAAGPTVESAFGDDGDTLSDAKTSDDKRKVGGREFECKKVTASAEPNAPVADAFTLWACPEVKVLGVVEMKVSGKEPADMKLVGFGNGDKAEWGKTPEENK